MKYKTTRCAMCGRKIKTKEAWDLSEFPDLAEALAGHSVTTPNTCVVCGACKVKLTTVDKLEYISITLNLIMDQLSRSLP